MTQTATFAGGCFWCIASAFDGTKGIENIVSGYMGGDVDNPSYELVCTGQTGHAYMTFNLPREANQFLSFDQVKTVFHEFGHAFNIAYSDTKY